MLYAFGCLPKLNVSQPSRVAANFVVELFDWNQLETAKSLGAATIDLARLESFQAMEVDLPLASSKYGEKGHIRMRLMFHPEIIARSRKNTSTFSAAGRSMTQLPVSAGKGVFQGVAGVFGRKSRDEDDRELEAPHTPAGQASHALSPESRNGSTTAFPMFSGRASTDGLPAMPNGGSSQEAGTLRVTLVSGKDIGDGDDKPYTTLRIGDKEFKSKYGAKTATPEWYVNYSQVDSPF